MSAGSLLDGLARREGGVFEVGPEEFAKIEAYLLEKKVCQASFRVDLGQLIHKAVSRTIRLILPWGSNCPSKSTLPEQLGLVIGLGSPATWFRIKAPSVHPVTSMESF